MAYYDALVAKWATLTGTTQQKLDAINALTVPGPTQPVQILDVMDYLRSQGAWLPIKAAAATNSAAAAAVDLNDDVRARTIDLTLPIVGQMLAALVASSLLTQAQSDAINAMKNPPMPWWLAGVAQGGGGLNSSVSNNDLVAAGGLV